MKVDSNLSRSRLLWGILVGIALSVLVHKVYTEIIAIRDEGRCGDRITTSVRWEGYISKKDGITYCFEKTAGYPHKTIYRGVVAVD